MTRAESTEKKSKFQLVDSSDIRSYGKGEKDERSDWQRMEDTAAL